MEVVVDSDGRVVLPKPLRDALGLIPGSTVDISAYGGGLQIVPGGRTARLERDDDGCLVAKADTVVTDGLSGHALAETYSVLTRLPGDARVLPSDAVTLIDENFAAPLQFGARASRARRGIAGGATYEGSSHWPLVSTAQFWRPGMRVPGRPTWRSV